MGILPRKAEASGPEGSGGPELQREGSSVGLRLAIGKDGLGIELARRAALACLDVVELVIRLPNVRFPFDVTGGVAKFRHRRGELERIAIELDARRAARWAEPLLHGLLGAEPVKVTLAPRAFATTVTVVAAGVPAALAFEVGLVGSPDLAVVVHSARGVNLPAPATLLAIRAAQLILGDAARREGARFIIPRAAERIARVLLPDAGVRAPHGADVGLLGSGESDGVLFIAFARPGARERDRDRESAVQLPAASTLAHEATLLARAGDDARVAGEYDRARSLDLAALERAPRHAQISQRIAELDARAGGRAEAAVAMIRSADRPAYQGSLLGDLLLEMGDRPGAIAALLREGERDPAASVAALAFARAAALAPNPADALTWLDRAVARSPTLVALRWDRAARRVEQGRLADARADFQELEALATGAHERYDTLRRAADIHRERGLPADAAALYERALLYRPDDPSAVAGLGAAIAAEGRAARGATLLARAIDLASTIVPPFPTAWMELELGKVLGDRLEDRPAAVARLRAVPDDAAEAIAARGLEGRYRAALGDFAGASLAFARLRERAGREPSAASWLEEAATFEESRGDLVRAQSHLLAALAIVPTSVSLQDRVALLSSRLSPVNVPVPVPVPEKIAAPAPEAVPTPEVAVAVVGPTPEEDEARVEALTRTLQGDPTNDAVVDELAERLTRLGRSMDFLALLSARIEDAPPERRAQLLPRHREVLLRLEEEASAAGRDGEADLFKMAREMVRETPDESG